MRVQVKFNPQDARSYTYIYDGEDKLAIGDLVLVETKTNYGFGVACVRALNAPEVNFNLSKIVGKIDAIKK